MNSTTSMEEKCPEWRGRTLSSSLVRLCVYDPFLARSICRKNKRLDCFLQHTVPDTYIQKTKKTYVDSRGRRHLGSINNELQDVQRIMVANIEEVLQRGEALSGKCRNYLLIQKDRSHLNVCLSPAALDTKASNLTSLSKKYRSDAKYLNTRSTYAKVAAVSVFFLTLIIYVRFWWLWWTLKPGHISDNQAFKQIQLNYHYLDQGALKGSCTVCPCWG